MFKTIPERQEEALPTVGQNVCKGGVYLNTNFTFRDPAGNNLFLSILFILFIYCYYVIYLCCTTT